ncbi:unnamed protein product [Phytophthora fragariaefolia]|uniref:Unnamed protein product n=1 Tax=Phytophthora fragariaefolia TaxID=1490495 RepID=A0A9W6XUP8_9STRA|nr:unnamed protein product [Phytophthora fragariaefolia]
MSREQEQEEQQSSRARQATTPTPATPPARAASVTPATSSPPEGHHRGGHGKQKRKRGTPNSGSVKSSSPRRENDAESNGADAEGGVFFRSAWMELIMDPSKKARMEKFFQPSLQLEPTRRTLPRSTDSEVSVQESEAPTEILAPSDDGNRDEVHASVEERQTRGVEVHVTTDAETDDIISQLQFETNQDMPCVVHALYYCSGNTVMAREFLMGALPSGMWSPDDDLLLVSLVTEESIDRSVVDAAVAHGDFTAMQRPRDTDAILERVRFLR